MQTPMDSVFDGMGFDEYGHWHKGSLMDYWRWGFSDLADEAMQSTVVDLLAKVWLGVGPGFMTPEELRILAVSGPVAEELRPSLESGIVYDA
ncbi:MAG: hypothetical protein WBW84_10145 [Acidobacteriaceae bacterium]